MPGEKVLQLGLERQRGFIAFVDADGSVLATKLGGDAASRTPQVLLERAVRREDGFVYYLDEDGDIARAVVARGGEPETKTSKAKSKAKAAKAKTRKS
jgi:hypothetical protein